MTNKERRKSNELKDFYLWDELNLKKTEQEAWEEFEQLRDFWENIEQDEIRAAEKAKTTAVR